MTGKLFYVIIACLLWYNVKAQQPSFLQLSNMFSSNMVLQQGIPVPVWGKGKPGTAVYLLFNGKKQTAIVPASGKWMVKLPPQQAGGPYTMQLINANDTVVFSNVMIGEVWVCSGQSNMEMPVADWGKVNNYEQEVAAANYPDIRLMHLKKSASNTPEEDPQLYNKEQWQVCSPATVRNFSAAAYFFARNVYTHHSVAIGLIQATYGGTVAEAWVSNASLKTMPDFTKEVESIEKQPQQIVMKLYNDQLQEWIKNTAPLDSGFQQGNPVWADDKADTSSWYNMLLPAYFDEAGLPDFYGIVWFKKKILLTEAMTRHDLKINIGSLGDEDITYFNGIEVGRANSGGKRMYIVPAKYLKQGDNLITIRLLVYHKYANIYGEGERFAVVAGTGDTLPLAGNWKYKAGYHASVLPPEEPTQPNRSTVLFNAMIRPVIPYGIRGVIWYQGEYNVGRAVQYRTLFPLLISDWRAQWKQGAFPFYFVQLANYKAKDTIPPASSEWAELREAQTYALKLPNTAMAVAIDLGEADDIHPKNKQEVGNRLALIARAKLYKENVSYTSPMYKYHTIKGDSVIIFFTQTAGGLEARGDTVVKGFTIAGSDNIYHTAHATIKGNTIVVYSTEVSNPKAVRYGWADNPECNVYSKLGLPLAPFRTAE